MNHAHERSQIAASSWRGTTTTRSWPRPLLRGASLPLVAMLVMAGCQGAEEVEQERAESCGEGRMETLGSGVYCIYQQPIIETRFDCPAFAPHFSRHDSQTVVCASTAELPVGFDDLVSMDPGQPDGGEDPVVEDPVTQDPMDPTDPDEGPTTDPVSPSQPVCEHGFGDGCQDAIVATAEAQPYGAQSLAVRLAELLWADAPDAALLQAANDGSLATRSGVHAQVDRMMQDARFEQNMDDFWLAYLGLGHLQANITGLDPSHPLYTPTLAPSLLSSALETVHTITLEDEEDVREVWTSKKIMWNEDVAPYYGATVMGQGFEVGVMSAESSGILTHPAFLTGSSLISSRGVAALSQLCVEVPAPPAEAMPPMQGSAHDTYREGLEVAVSPAECSACHAQIDPPGFALYGFDAMGQRLALDQDGQAFDNSGQYDSGATFADTEAFAQLFRDDERLSSCLTTRLYQHLGGGVTGLDAATIAPVIHAHLLGAGTFTMRDLVRAVATSDTMLYRP